MVVRVTCTVIASVSYQVACAKRHQNQLVKFKQRGYQQTSLHQDNARSVSRTATGISLHGQQLYHIFDRVHHGSVQITQHAETCTYIYDVVALIATDLRDKHIFAASSLAQTCSHNSCKHSVKT
jgi:hypothetical protein